MDEEELEQPRKKITLSNFFDSIVSVEKVADRALKKTNANLDIINQNKSLIAALTQSFDDLKVEIREIKEYITIEKDLEKDKSLSQEDQEQKLRRLERTFMGGEGSEGSLNPEDEKQQEDFFDKALKNPNVLQIIAGGVLSVVAFGGGSLLSAFGIKTDSQKQSEQSGKITGKRGFFGGVGGTIDAITGNLTDFDRRGGKPVAATRAATGIIDFFTGNLFDLDRRGDFLNSREDLAEMKEKLKERKRIGKEIKGFNLGGPVFDNDNDTTNNNEDSVPAMLTPGEFVVTKDAVDKIGVDTLKGLNASVGATNKPTRTVGYRRGQITPDELIMSSKKIKKKVDQRRRGGQGGNPLGLTTRRGVKDEVKKEKLFGEDYAGISKRMSIKTMDVIDDKHFTTEDGTEVFEAGQNIIKEKIVEKDIVSIALEDIMTHQDDLVKRIRKVKGYEDVTIEDVLNKTVDMPEQQYIRILGHSDAAKATKKKRDEARKLDKEKYGDEYYNYFDKGFNQGGLVEGVKKMYSSEIEENKSKNNLKPLLDMIGSGESDNVGGYSAMFPSESYPEMLDMSINELIEFQKEKLKDGRKSVAVGRYQMLYPEDYAAAAGLSLTAKFTPKNQDKMVIAYLKKNRKLNEFIKGEITNEQFSEELSQEFGTFKSASGFVLPNNTGSIDFPMMVPVLNKIKNNLKPETKSSDNLQSVIESKSDQLAQNIFTPPTTQSNNVNLLPIPITQQQSQPVNGNVPVSAPQVIPQVSTTPVTSTMSTVSFINMISNKQLSVG